MNPGEKADMWLAMDSEVQSQRFRAAEYIGWGKGTHAFHLGMNIECREQSGRGELVFGDHRISGHLCVTVDRDWGDSWYLHIAPDVSALDEVLS